MFLFRSKNNKNLMLYNQIDNSKIINNRSINYSIGFNRGKRIFSSYCVRLILGSKCNYSCLYCINKNKDNEKNLSIADLLKNIHRVTLGRYKSFQLWGGEPLIYFDKCLEIARWFDVNNINNVPLILSTNGILLDNKDIQGFILKYIVNLQISWDGPGQYLRGKDPFENSEIVNFVKKFMNIEGKKLVIKPTLSTENYIRRESDRLFKEIFDDTNYQIGPFPFIKPLDDNMVAYHINKLTVHEDYWDETIRDISDNMIPNWYYLYGDYQYKFWNNMSHTRDCLSPSPGQLIIDNSGDVLSCSYIDKDIKDEYSNLAVITNISKMSKNEQLHMLFPVVENRLANSCKNCIVYNFCKGGCGLVPSNYMKRYCEGRILELLPMFIGNLYNHTGILFDKFEMIT